MDGGLTWSGLDQCFGREGMRMKNIWRNPRQSRVKQCIYWRKYDNNPLAFFPVREQCNSLHSCGEISAHVAD